MKKSKQRENKKLISEAIKIYIEMIKTLVDENIYPELIDSLLYNVKARENNFRGWEDARRVLDSIVYYGLKTRDEQLKIAEMFGIKIKQ